LDVEGIDPIYLNAYQPMLQTGGGVAIFFKKHRGATVASTSLIVPISRAFVDETHYERPVFSATVSAAH